MKSLVITANPNKSGFGAELTNQFIQGIKDAGHDIGKLDLFENHFHTGYTQSNDRNEMLIEAYKEHILECDAICFSFPLWCEMPPYPLVAFMQKILVNGFAYTHDGVTKTPILNLPISLIITMGQTKNPNLTYLIEALGYVGLHHDYWHTVIAQGVGPDMPEHQVNTYKSSAYQAGLIQFKIET